MYKWAVRRMIHANVRRLAAGDPAPLLAGYAENATLVFPGSSSWGGEHRGKPAIEKFLERFLDAGMRGEAHEILVNGPPWRTLVCVLFTNEGRSADGTLVYENRAVLFARIVWGRIRYQEDYEDTEKVAAFDRYLAEPPARRSDIGAAGHAARRKPTVTPPARRPTRRDRRNPA